MSAHPPHEQLSAFLDEELADEVRLPLEEHLRTCDACASHLAELAAVDEAARALPIEEPAGYFDDFAARVRARVDIRTPRRTLPVWSWAAAAAVLLAVVTPLALRERAAQAPAATAVREEAPAPSAAGAPPALAKPQAPPPDGAYPTMAQGADRSLQEDRGRRANEAERHDRLERRDQPAESPPEFQSRVSQDKREQAPAPAEPGPETAAPSRLAEKTAENLKTLGYVAPPPAMRQRQHGPRSQQYAPPPPAAAPPATADEVAASAAPAADGTPDGFRDADLSKEKDDRSPRAKRSSASEAGGAAAGRVAAETKLGATASVMKSVPAQTGEEARRRREAFRKMAGERPDEASADEARVGTIEEGVRAFRLEGRAEDRATAERDGRAYLARPDALQATRVRALLQTLREPRS